MKEKVDCPVCGEGAFLKQEQKDHIFRLKSYRITEHFYICNGCGEDFTTQECDDVNYKQLLAQYRENSKSK